MKLMIWKKELKIMCITENNEELNISFEKASDILLKMFDKNYVRIKKEWRVNELFISKAKGEMYVTVCWIKN